MTREFRVAPENTSARPAGTSRCVHRAATTPRATITAANAANRGTTAASAGSRSPAPRICEATTVNSVTTMSGTIAAVNPHPTAAAHRTPLEQRRERERRQDQQDQGTDERPGVDHGHRRLAGDDAQQHGQHGQDGQHDQLDEHEQWSRRQQPLGRPARERGERDDVVHARGQQHEEHAHEQRGDQGAAGRGGRHAASVRSDPGGG